MGVKRIFTLTLCVVLLLTLSVTVYARGHGNRVERQPWNRVMQQQRFEICILENCEMIGLHQHGGVFYRCADYGRGFGRGFFGTEHRNENRHEHENRHGNRWRNGSWRNR